MMSIRIFLQTLAVLCAVLISSFGTAFAQTSNAPPESLKPRCQQALSDICSEIRKIQPQYPELSKFRCPDTVERPILQYWYKVEEVTGTKTKGKSDAHPEPLEGGCLLQIEFLGGQWQNYGHGPNQRVIVKMYARTNVLVQAVIQSPNKELVERLEKIVRARIPDVPEK